MKLLAVLLIAVVCQGVRGPLTGRINAAIRASSVARGAFWGIEVYDLTSGRRTVSLNEQQFFVPASNTKLFTTALALSRLGAGFQVETVVAAAAAPDAEGRIAGSLTLIGAGDANLSGRPIPYDVEAPKQDPLSAMRDLARQLFERGVRSVGGGVIGDDTVFPYEPYGPGWGVDDPATSDGAPVSALAVNDNAITLLVEPAKLTFVPALSVFTVENRIVAGTERDLHVTREAGSATLRLWGTLPVNDAGETFALGVDDAARFAAIALTAALKEQGISVAGNAIALHRYPGAEIGFVSPNRVTLATHRSPPLIEDLRVTDKVSQNLHAEMLLRLVGKGSRRDGLKELDDFVAQAGIEKTGYAFHDGSGMSRLNVVTPHTVVQLLTFMARSPLAADFASLLPVAGVDGSLRLRFAGNRAKGKVFAKTGSLSHTSALSGYAVRANGHKLAFSILVNNYNGPTSAIRETIDRICALLVE